MRYRFVVDENMPDIERWFSDHASSIIRKNGRVITRSDLIDADVLLVRSITQVNPHLLCDTPVKFVGSATIGTDHIDQKFLAQSNIAFAHAPGSNAQSVVDWLLSALSSLYLNNGLRWWEKTIGVVGVGNVGYQVVKRLERFGCKLLMCDPPKYDSKELTTHTEIREVFKVADIICLHTPLTRLGNYATYHMIDEKLLSIMKPGSWLINAGRGQAVEEMALISHLKSQKIHAVLDVWPNEPGVSKELLSLVELASPHVAGYSQQGKANGTEMLARAFATWAGVELASGKYGASLNPSLVINAKQFEDADDQRWAANIVLAVYNPRQDTQAMFHSLVEGQITKEIFDGLRKNYPNRTEIHSVVVTNATETLKTELKKFGFSLFD